MRFTKPLCLALSCAGMFALPACSTVRDMPGQAASATSGPIASLRDLFDPSEEVLALRAARAEGHTLTHPSRKADLHKVLKKVSRTTEATAFSDNRVRIHSDGMLLGGNERSEIDFFIRAATETLQAGHDGFVIVHLDYFTPGPQLLTLTPNLNFASDRWVGTYEDFLRHRNEQNLFKSRNGMNRRVRQGVILMIDDDQYPNRDRFDAQDIYLNLIEARYAL